MATGVWAYEVELTLNVGSVDKLMSQFMGFCRVEANAVIKATAVSECYSGNLNVIPTVLYCVRIADTLQ